LKNIKRKVNKHSSVRLICILFFFYKMNFELKANTKSGKF
jgi:hypothetical protein